MGSKLTIEGVRTVLPNACAVALKDTAGISTTCTDAAERAILDYIDYI